VNAAVLATVTLNINKREQRVMKKIHNAADIYIDGKLIEIRVLNAHKAFAQKSINDLTGRVW
ncbi:MAG: hypothetical protein AAF404_09845, partial [Pseudomonadota bacterium]